MNKEAEETNEKVKNIWNENAGFWDERFGDEGNIFHRSLLEPSQIRMLKLREGDRVLDIACGNGHFSRRMAKEGATVVAFDMSEKFIEKAKDRSIDFGERISYSVIDATEKEELEKLGEKSFDAAVCTMALMDMAHIEPLIQTLGMLLKNNGRFVFSVMHPCFNSPTVRRVIEQEDREGEIVRTYSVKVSEYITSTVKKGLGIIGQPEPQYYFHRSITTLFGICFKSGFVLDRIEEPVFPPPVRSAHPLLWENFSEIPPALIARMRLIYK